MLTEQEIRKMPARAFCMMLLTVAGALGVSCLSMAGTLWILFYFKEPLVAWMATSQFGEMARETIPLLIPLSGFAGFLPTFGFMARYAKRLKIQCPCCHQDISPGIEYVLLTRTCPACSERVLPGGRAHSAAVLRRHCNLKRRQMIRYVLWFWPAFAAAFVAIQWFRGSALHRPLGFGTVPLFLGGLFGTITAAYAWLRTFDRQYFPPLAISAVLLGLSAFLFWRTL